MTRDEATRLAFAAGVRYAAESIGHLLDELALCTTEMGRCETCDAYHVASGAVAKWAATELEGATQ